MEEWIEFRNLQRDVAFLALKMEGGRTCANEYGQLLDTEKGKEMDFP